MKGNTKSGVAEEKHLQLCLEFTNPLENQDTTLCMSNLMQMHSLQNMAVFLSPVNAKNQERLPVKTKYVFAVVRIYFDVNIFQR